MKDVAVTSLCVYRGLCFSGVHFCKLIASLPPSLPPKTNRKFEEKANKTVTTKPITKTYKPRGGQERCRLNILRCDYKRSPCSKCSHTAGAHRHEPLATFTHVPTEMWEVASSQKQQRRVSATRITRPTNAHSDFGIHCESFLMLIPFGRPSAEPRRRTTKTPPMTLTPMFACDMCKTRAPNTHDAPTLGPN